MMHTKIIHLHLELRYLYTHYITQGLVKCLNYQVLVHIMDVHGATSKVCLKFCIIYA